MSEAPQRGSIVRRGELYGVVWAVRGEDILVILPVTKATKGGRGAHRRAYDVDLSLGEMIAAAIALPAGFIEAGEPVEADRSGQAVVGSLTGSVLCRVVRAVARAHDDAITEARWDAERRHRHEANTIGVVRL